MLTKLLISPALNARVGEIEKILSTTQLTTQHPDVLFFDNSAKLGVEQAKQIREFLSIKPYQTQGRVVIVTSAHNFSVDAQNSLLKTLEEPPVDSLIILGANQESQLLPTILSRCQIVFLDSENNSSIKEIDTQKYFSEIEKLQKSSLQERFRLIEKMENREELLQSLIKYYHQKLKSNPKLVKYTKQLLQAETWQKGNVNTRAILEYLMFDLPSK